MPRVTQLHVAYRRRMDRIRRETTAMVAGADHPSPGMFVGAAVPLVLEAQAQAVQATDTYMSLEAGLATNSTIEPWGLDPGPLSGRFARGGVWLEDVYGRNHRTGGQFVTRMAREVWTDISLAARGAAWVHTEGDPRITGWRRVLSASTENCGLCVVASTQRYRSGDLNPIHAHCACTVAPIYAGSLDQPPDPEALQELYDRAGGADYESLRPLRVHDDDLPAGINVSRLPEVTVIDTAELGPTLVPA